MTDSTADPPTQYISGIEGWILLRQAGFRISKDVFYRELSRSRFPGAVRLGRNWHVPADIVDRLLNRQT
ncbi:MAG: hypothetical protein O2821_13755 [Chloroflexi bacterium]|nr:hypothetical protein [Chloroflexota bacterium]MDA1229100.1 hypothetical protein [Chloroflexota bacterium]